MPGASRDPGGSVGDRSAGPTHMTVDDLWRAYHSTRSPALRDRLVVHYAPLLRFVASRIAAALPRALDRADLTSEGSFGLLAAVERFDPDRGVRFESYARPRIHGAMLDGLRRMDWVPRTIRARAKLIDRTLDELAVSLERSPTDVEVAARLGLTLPELRASLQEVASMALLSLDATRPDDPDGECLRDSLADRDTAPVDGDAVRSAVREALDALPERERRVVLLYHFEGFTLSQIGEILGVSESRVCQVHMAAVRKLRVRMSGSDPDRDRVLGNVA